MMSCKGAHNKSLEGTANSAAFIRKTCVVVAVRRRPSAPALGGYLVNCDNRIMSDVDCIFCKISSGQAPASFVFQSEEVFAIMSLDQPNPYKVLVVPRSHIENIYDLSAENAAHIFQATVKIARAIREASGCDGLNLVQSNGRAGQQEVFHFHLHLVPRFNDDDILLSWENTQAERSELNRMAEEICSKLEN